MTPRVLGVLFAVFAATVPAGADALLLFNPIVDMTEADAKAEETTGMTGSEPVTVTATPTMR